LASSVAARSVATSADTDFWRGAGVGRARLAAALSPLGVAEPSLALSIPNSRRSSTMAC
jgi:hypothetical protein